MSVAILTSNSGGHLKRDLTSDEAALESLKRKGNKISKTSLSLSWSKRRVFHSFPLQRLS